MSLSLTIRLQDGWKVSKTITRHLKTKRHYYYTNRYERVCHWDEWLKSTMAWWGARFLVWRNNQLLRSYWKTSTNLLGKLKSTSLAEKKKNSPNYETQNQKNIPSNYRPIAYLPNMWKLFICIIGNKIYNCYPMNRKGAFLDQGEQRINYQLRKPHYQTIDKQKWTWL